MDYWWIIGGLLLNYVTNRLYIVLHMKLMYSLSCDMISHMQQISLEHVIGVNTAYMSQRINADSDSIVTYSLSLIQNVLINTLIFVLSSLSILFFNKKIAGILLFLLVVYPIIYKLFKKPLIKVNYSLKEKQATYFNKLHEQLNYISYIKSRGFQNVFISRFNPAYNAAYSAGLKQQVVFYAFSGLDSIISAIAQIFVFLIGGTEVIKGSLSIGKFTIISSYFNMMLNSIRFFFSLGKSTQESLVAYNRLNEILSIKIERNGSIVLSNVDIIEMEDVSFAYQNNTVIRNFSHTFRKGNIYAIKGSNGAGKSTLLNLIIGMYMNGRKGTIRFNNKSIEDLDMIYMRKNKIGYLEQDPILIEDTIEYNIFGEDTKNHNINDYNSMISAFGLNNFIYSLPNGLDIILNEKIQNISGGEKQKISLLRILINNPDVLILDEPTSALDSNSKENFIKLLKIIRNNKIIIVATHDSDLLNTSDEFLVM